MRPLNLSMTAFGPFAKTETIDFQALGNTPLFLINGATGSGKTTILDGICYALYGKTTGNERDAAQMRCDHAADDVITEVELSFVLGEKQYRIVRQPDQLRKKSRGDGFTNHKANAQLFAIASSGAETVMVPAKVKQANQTIEQLTGLNVEQFRQVMVLPQGEFRRLLTANSADREAVFSQLFQTQIYKRMEAALALQAKALRGAREANQNQQKGILVTADVDSEQQLESALEEVMPLLQAALASKQVAKQQQQSGHEKLLAAQKLKQEYERLQQQQKLQLELQQQTDLIAQQAMELARAQACLKISAQYQQQQLSEKNVVDAQQQLDKSIHEQQQAKNHFVQTKTGLAKVQKEAKQIDGLRSQRQQLEAYKPRLTLLTTLQKQAAEKQSKQKKAQGAQALRQRGLKQQQQDLQKLKQQQDGLNRQRKQTHASPVALLKLQQQVKLRAELQQLSQQQNTHTSTLASQQQQAANALTEFNRCETILAELDMQWHLGQAAVLAQQLQLDEPCLVCGSCKHPSPAQSMHQIPTQQQRDNAKKRLNQSRQICVDIDKNLAQSKTTQQLQLQRGTILQQELGDAAVQSLSQLEQECETMAVELKKLAEQEAKLEKIQKQMVESARHLEASTDELQKQQQQLSDLTTQLEVAQNQLHTAKQELPEAYREPSQLEQAINKVTTQLQHLQQQLEQAQINYENANLQQTRADSVFKSNTKVKAAADLHNKDALTAWQQALTSSNFVDQAQYLTAVRDQQQIDSLQASINAHAQAIAANDGAIKAIQQGLKGKTQPQLALLQQQLDQHDKQLAQANDQLLVVDKRHSSLLAVKTKLHQVQQDNLQIEQQYAVVGTLADVAMGKTGNRVSLQRFVLSVLLDDILIQASHRLKAMSKGRYQLYRRQDKGKGAGASGLELMVEDAYNGKQRSVATLSGGESFMAALSLALGLAEVVQAYAGGIKLDTLFIDEGFGSLDPEALDLAVNTLMDLQASGRMIGVISHVPELKERINVRLDVHSDSAGSRTQAVLA